MEVPGGTGIDLQLIRDESRNTSTMFGLSRAVKDAESPYKYYLAHLGLLNAVDGIPLDTSHIFLQIGCVVALDIFAHNHDASVCLVLYHIAISIGPYCSRLVASPPASMWNPPLGGWCPCSYGCGVKYGVALLQVSLLY